MKSKKIETVIRVVIAILSGIAGALGYNVML